MSRMESNFDIGLKQGLQNTINPFQKHLPPSQERGSNHFDLQIKTPPHMVLIPDPQHCFSPTHYQHQQLFDLSTTFVMPFHMMQLLSFVFVPIVLYFNSNLPHHTLMI